MKSVDVRTASGTRTLELHDAITVVPVGVDERTAIARELALAWGALNVVDPSELPTPAPAPVTDPSPSSLVDAEAAVSAAESALEEARRGVVAAEREYTAAQDAVIEANRAIDREAADAVAAAEARLEVAQAAAASAARALDQAREARDQELAEAAARDESVRKEVERLQARRSEVEARRSEVAARLAELGPATDGERVVDALSGLRRLKEVKPKPSARGTELAEEWVAVRRRLADLPTPPGPPEWLVTPALAALQEAREALAKAEAVASGGGPDPERADAVERAHREVLDAEQRVMRKGSRLNRRRLEQAQEAERDALQALGVASYGEYLQQVAPSVDVGQTPEDRVAAARAALADAEAVWEELHGGQASPEYTAAKEDEARVRADAHALLEEEIADETLESALREHLEAVVDTGWAEQALVDAMRESGVAPVGDLEASAEAWLASLPEQRERRAAVEAELADVVGVLADVDRELAELQPKPAEGETPEASAPPAGDPFADLRAAVEDAERAEREAAESLADAQRRVESNATAQRDAVAKEQESDRALAALDEARSRVADAEAALEAARAAATQEPAPPPDPAPSDEAPSAATEVWLLARLVASRATATGGGDDRAPVVVDARVASRPRVRSILERAARSGQVVVLGDEDDITAWASSLGDRAAVRTI